MAPAAALDPDRAASILESADYIVRKLVDLPLGQAVCAAWRGPAPRVLVLAGSHADEVAGVVATMEIARGGPRTRRLGLLPIRDPIGWRGFNWTLSKVTGREVRIRDHAGARATLPALTDVVLDDGDLMVGVAGDFGFASRHYSRYVSSDLARWRLQATLEPGALERFEGRRVLLPASGASEPDRSPYDWGGNTACVGSDGWVGNLNCFFDRGDAPAEVSAVKEFVDQVAPPLTLDLHEGFGTGFYLFVQVCPDDATLGIAGAMCRAVVEAGGRIATGLELDGRWRPEAAGTMVEHLPGVFSMAGPSGAERGMHSRAAARFGPTITTETGMELPLAVRTRLIVAAATAALERLEELEVQ